MVRRLTKSKKHLFGKVVKISLPSLALLVNAPATLADDYMDALRDEATTLEYLDESRASNTVTTNKNAPSQEIQQALSSIDAFEKYFKKSDSATAAVYFRLTARERLRIYHRFKASKDFGLARNMTIELYNRKR